MLTSSAQTQRGKNIGAQPRLTSVCRDGYNLLHNRDFVGRLNILTLRPNKSVAEGAVDTVLAAIGEVLAKDEEVRIVGVGKFATRSRCGIVTSFLNAQSTYTLVNGIEEYDKY